MGDFQGRRLITDGMELTSGIIQQDVYAGLVAAIILASRISAIHLRRAYEKEANNV